MAGWLVAGLILRERKTLCWLAEPASRTRPCVAVKDITAHVLNVIARGQLELRVEAAHEAPEVVVLHDGRSDGS